MSVSFLKPSTKSCGVNCVISLRGHRLFKTRLITAIGTFCVPLVLLFVQHLPNLLHHVIQNIKWPVSVLDDTPGNMSRDLCLTCPKFLPAIV